MSNQELVSDLANAHPILATAHLVSPGSRTQRLSVAHPSFRRRPAEPSPRVGPLVRALCGSVTDGRYFIQVILEEVGIDIEGHRDGSMSNEREDEVRGES